MIDVGIDISKSKSKAVILNGYGTVRTKPFVFRCIFDYTTYYNHFHHPILKITPAEAEIISIISFICIAGFRQDNCLVCEIMGIQQLYTMDETKAARHSCHSALIHSKCIFYKPEVFSLIREVCTKILHYPAENRQPVSHGSFIYDNINCLNSCL